MVENFGFEIESVNLSNLIRKSKKLKSLPETITDAGIYLSDFKKLQKIIEKRISEILFKKNLIASDYFLCSIYIANLISETVKNPPKSWYSIDYIFEIKDEDDYLPWKRAGDVCFLICSVFVGRSNRRIMRTDDYVAMGRSFYSNYYRKGNKEIGYMMSNKYMPMMHITREALKKPF